MCKLVGRTAEHGRNDPRIRRAYAGETNAMLRVGQKCPTSVLPATRGPRWRVECWLAIIAIEPAVSLQWEQTWHRTLALIGEFKVENGPRFGAVLRVVLKVVLDFAVQNDSSRFRGRFRHAQTATFGNTD